MLRFDNTLAKVNIDSRSVRSSWITRYTQTSRFSCVHVPIITWNTSE